MNRRDALKTLAVLPVAPEMATKLPVAPPHCFYMQMEFGSLVCFKSKGEAVCGDENADLWNKVLAQGVEWKKQGMPFAL